MQQNSKNDIVHRIAYLVGTPQVFDKLEVIPSRVPFDENVLDFLNTVSRNLMKDPRSRDYSDVITFAFWIRKSSTIELKKRYEISDGSYSLGKGVVFHISPSNVPVNFAYSLVAGLLSGNANVVRIPSKNFVQIDIIADAFRKALEEYSDIEPYITLVRYERDKEINDFISSICDVRVIWGGDNTISEIRKSPLKPRGTEITFADRYSLAVIDSDYYMGITDKLAVAKDFYNDTYFTDQNACTSPRLVVWIGNSKSAAKEIFWNMLFEIVRDRYVIQDIQGVDKLDRAYLLAAQIGNVQGKVIGDNRLIVSYIQHISAEIMNYKGNSGFFMEYDCDDIMDLSCVCDDKRCQTIGYIGNKNALLPLVLTGIKGIDRIVPIGKTMDFDLIWDGYDLIGQLSRVVSIY